MSAALARLRRLVDFHEDDADDRRGLRDAVLFAVYAVLAVLLVSVLVNGGVPL